MLANSQEELKTLVLLEFTKRLIMYNSPTIFLKGIEREKPIKKTEKEKFREIVKSRIPELAGETPLEIFEKPARTTPSTKVFVTPRVAPRPVLRVPETRLPPQFAYLRPTATKEIELNLGKLNPLLADPGVNVIESNGAEQQVIVRGTMGVKPTSIVLTREEINKIIQTFSEKSKIPIGEGAVKIALGRFILSAIISAEAGSRFIIKKLPRERAPIMPRK